MKIYLTIEQITDVEKRLDEVLEEELTLREKDKIESVSGWDFVALSNEEITLKEILKNGTIETLDLH
jgi:hypothetical protein